MPEVASLILAAGRGTRFGASPKLLAAFEGRPLVRHAAEAALAATPRPVIAVLGAHADAVEAALAGLVLTVVRNPDHADGLSTTLRAGLAALPPDCTGVVVVLGDMPRVTARVIDGLVDAFDRAGRRVSAVVPVHDGRRGNPVLLNLAVLAPGLAGLRGDHGAGRLLAERDDVLDCPGEPGTALDIDTPEALAALASHEDPSGA